MKRNIFNKCIKKGEEKTCIGCNERGKCIEFIEGGLKYYHGKNISKNRG